MSKITEIVDDVIAKTNTNTTDIATLETNKLDVAIIHTATSKTTPIDNDELVILNSTTAYSLNKLTWANLKTSLGSLFAPLESPSFTGTPNAPTASAGTNSTQIATTAYVDKKFTLSTLINASGTAIDFTGIPSWTKRITVILNGISTSGSSHILVQIGDGTISTTGYISGSGTTGATSSGVNSTIGNILFNSGNSYTMYGTLTLTKINTYTWVSSHSIGASIAYATTGGGTKTLTASLDRIRITTVNGTDTFDAGQINIMYEG